MRRRMAAKGRVEAGAGLRRLKVAGDERGGGHGAGRGEGDARRGGQGRNDDRGGPERADAHAWSRPFASTRSRTTSSRAAWEPVGCSTAIRRGSSPAAPEGEAVGSPPYVRSRSFV